MLIQARLNRLRRQISDYTIDAFLISQPENLYYLSGCEGLEGYLLITADQAVIVTDFRYIEQARRQSPEFDLFRISGKMAEWLPALLTDRCIKSLGFESGFATVAFYEQLSAILKNLPVRPTLVPVNGLVENLRAVKDMEEIVNIEKAARITDAVLAHIETILEPGLTEKQLAWMIEKYMREQGSQSVPFELIVAAGPNGALPHARPSDRLIKAGEPIVVDIGSRYNFYGSDLTRTLCIGQPDDTFKKVYEIVLKAQMAAIENIRPGMTGAEADAIARQVISKAGYGESFGHGLGHGIGLTTHENPHVSLNSTDILTDGMVFTIEPGIYLSGWGGVRIEDDIVIESGKIKVISSARK
jgi:Xaa-Pro aminopeptidase